MNLSAFLTKSQKYNVGEEMKACREIKEAITSSKSKKSRIGNQLHRC
jgi:hypothetical protein